MGDQLARLASVGNCHSLGKEIFHLIKKISPLLSGEFFGLDF